MISKNDLHDISDGFAKHAKEEELFCEIRAKIIETFNANESIQIIKANAADIKNVLFKDSVNVDNRIILKFILINYIPKGRMQSYSPMPGMPAKNGVPYIWIRDMAVLWKTDILPHLKDVGF